MKLTNTPKVWVYDEDEWTDWLIENVAAINKNGLSEEEKRELYYQIFTKITLCGYYEAQHEDD